MLNFSNYNLSKCNISCKKKTLLNVRPKLFFWAETRKSYCTVVFNISTLKFFQTKFCPKIKIFKFETKTVLIDYFGLKFQKTNVEFEFRIPEFVNTQSFIQKNKKNLNLGAKIP